MNISNIFKELHGILNVKALIPMKNKTDIVSAEDFAEIVEYLNVDENNIYFDPNNTINWCIYYDGLVYCPLHHMKLEVMEMMHLKEMLHQQINYIHKLKDKNDYGHLFRMIDKKILIPAFIKYYKQIPKNQLYDIFVDLYQRTEYGFDQIPVTVIKAAFDTRNLSEEWHQRMNALKKKTKNKEFVKIYRGETPKSTPNNMSWTLSKKVAQFFATRFNSNGKILTKIVKVDDCLDYITSRNEAEILYLNK